MSTTLSALRRLPYAWLIVALTVAAGLSEGLGLVLFVPLVGLLTGESSQLPAPLRVIVDGFASLGLGRDPAALLAVIMAMIIASFSLILVHRVVVTRAQFKFTHGMRCALFDALLGARWAFLARQADGEILANLIQAAERAGQAMHHLGLFVGGVILLLVYGGLSAVLSWQLLILCAALAVVVILAARPRMRRAGRLGREVTETEQNYTFHAVDHLKGAKLIKVTGSEAEASEKMIAFGRKVTDTKTATQINSHVLDFMLQIAPVLVAAATIAVGVLAIRVEPSLIVVFLLVMARIAPRGAAVSQYLAAFRASLPALDEIDRRIAELGAHREDLNPGGVAFATLRRGIVLEGVDYRYQGADAPTLRGIDLAVARHAMVALVGSSGAGKSTLVEIIAGIRRPTHGRVLVDGVDLREMNMLSWRRRIGFVTQDTVIFDDSLRNNLLFAHPEATDEDIARVVALAHLEDVVAGLPEGLDTPLGQGGLRLSGGQKQRVALARALIGQTELLLLDEATSALDSESERHVQKAIENVARALTIVVIAHRLSTVRNADLICVMEQGRIVEQGTYDDLVAADGRFARLRDLQLT